MVAGPAKIAGVDTEDQQEPIQPDQRETDEGSAEIAGPAMVAGVAASIESIDPKTLKDPENQEKILGAKATPKAKTPREPRPTPEPLPQTALTKAMHEATPEDIRPVRCNYGKHNAAARSLYDAAWKPEQVTDFVAWSYQHDPYLNGQKDGERKVIWMGFVSENIKAKWPAVQRWIAAGRPTQHQTIERSEQKDERSILDASGRLERSYRI